MLWQTRCGDRDTVGRYARAAKFRCVHLIHTPLDARLRERPRGRWKGAWNNGGVAYEQNSKRPRDLNQWAKRMVDIAAGEASDHEPTPEEQGKDTGHYQTFRRARRPPPRDMRIASFLVGGPT